MSGSRRVVLITGATGFLGKVLLEELIRRRDELALDRVILLIRSLKGKGAAERFRSEVVPSPCFAALPEGWTTFVSVLEADLERPEISPHIVAHPLTKDVTHVVHAAASVRFDLPLADAARINIHGALSVLRLAKALPRVERFVYISTAFAAPHRAGAPMEEVPIELPAPAFELYEACEKPRTNVTALLARTRHPNTYTLTKAIAEHLLDTERGELPLTIVRPSIVTASRATPFPGWIDSTAGYAGFVMLTGAGYMRALVCDPAARLDLIPVDDVAHRIARALDETARGCTIRHATVGVAQSPTVADCWDGVQRYYTEHRVALRPSGRYLGPRGSRFLVADLVRHRAPAFVAGLRSSAARRQAEKVRSRIDRHNTDFAYFTTRTFDFRTSWPMEASFDGVAYNATMAMGVRRHLFKMDERGAATT